MQKAVDKSIAGYYRVNKSGIFMDVNKAWLRMHKYASSDEVLGKHFAITRDAKDLKDLEDTFNRVLAGETVIGKPVMRKCHDGSFGKHVLSMNPTLEGDVITGVEGFIIDLPDVGALQPQMDNIVRNSNAGYYRIDKNGYIVEVNDAWLAMYKCKDKESIIGKHFSVTRDEKNLGRLNEIFNNVLKNGATITSEVARRRCSDGSLGKHILSANPVYEGSEIIGMEGFILDISNLDDVKA
jgi:PAS domain S-box-containing protein